MSIKNIATCWSLILFKEPESSTVGFSKEILDSIATLNKILVVMLTEYKNIKQILKKLMELEHNERIFEKHL